jgi:hypothetical protein
VEQILLWHPNDVRLTWLLAELFNAQGDIVWALKLMDRLIDIGVSGEVREHRNTLIEAVEKLSKKPTGSDVQAPKVEAKDGNPAPPPQPAGTNGVAASWLPAWRPLVIGGGAGFVLGMLVILQLQQIFRKRV